MNSITLTNYKISEGANSSLALAGCSDGQAFDDFMNITQKSILLSLDKLVRDDSPIIQDALLSGNYIAFNTRGLIAATKIVRSVSGIEATVCLITKAELESKGDYGI